VFGGVHRLDRLPWDIVGSLELLLIMVVTIMIKRR
jgi:hypothetical protein